MEYKSLDIRFGRSKVVACASEQGKLLPIKVIIDFSFVHSTYIIKSIAPNPGGWYLLVYNTYLHSTHMFMFTDG